MENNNQPINFDEIYESCKKISEMVDNNDELGLKLNELFKGLFKIIEYQAQVISDRDSELDKLKEKYNDLKEDFDRILESNERKKRLIQQPDSLGVAAERAATPSRPYLSRSPIFITFFILSKNPVNFEKSPF